MIDRLTPPFPRVTNASTSSGFCLRPAEPDGSAVGENRRLLLDA